jgi:nitrogen-specific signal transduction histidine kinase
VERGPRMKPSPAITSATSRSVGISLIAAFGAVVGAFVAATWYSETHSRSIDAAALRIATGSAPLIERLAATRGALTQLRFAETTYAEGGGPRATVPASALLSHRDALAATLIPTARLVHLAGDAAGGRALPQTLHEIDGSLDAMVAAGRDAAALRRGDAAFRVTAERLATLLNQVIDATAEQTRHLALHIEEASARRRQLSFGLDLLCALATIAAALLLARALRGHDRLLRVHQGFLERRSVEMEAFAGRVAHDVRGSLAALSLCVQQIARLAIDERIRGMAARAQRSLDHLLRMTSGLLAFARAGARPEADAHADVAAVIDDVLSDLRPEATRAQIELAGEPGAIPLGARCSPGALSSMVLNLVSNALKHMGESARRCVTVRTLDRGPVVRIEVEDTGPGIAPDVRAAIFEPYVRGGNARGDGIGLGLATVKKLAEGHGGRVGVEPASAGGSLFWIELPRPVPAPARAPAAQTTAA